MSDMLMLGSDGLIGLIRRRGNDAESFVQSRMNARFACRAAFDPASRCCWI